MILVSNKQTQMPIKSLLSRISKWIAEKDFQTGAS